MDEVSDIEIRKRTELFINSDEDLKKHVKQIEACIVFLHELILAVESDQEHLLILDRLAVRSLNSIIASYWLVRSGLYQPSITMVRDVVETSFLLDLFSIDPTQILVWAKGTEKEKNAFRPFEVRKYLDNAKNQKNSKRDEIYKFMSKQAAHPDSDGFSVISPNNMTQIGPFPDFALFKACIEDITKHAVYLALIFGTSREKNNVEAEEIAEIYFDETRVWVDVYMLGKDQ